MMNDQEMEAAASRPPETRSTFDRFTGRSRKVLASAQEEAVRFNHKYIDTEHLLLGLLWMDEGVAVRALARLGVTPDQVRAAVKDLIGRSDYLTQTDPGLTLRAKRALELAVEEAHLVKQSYVCTEHILLGLIRTEEGIAAEVLAGFDVSLERVHAEVARILAPRPKNTVIMCRLDDQARDALDTLIEAGICGTRSEAASWLVQAGIEAHATLFERVSANVAQIRRLREETQQLAQEAAENRTAAVVPPSYEQRARPPLSRKYGAETIASS
jgi:ATP-dependent Clp protease ATP-binding subunit ClpA